MTDDFGKRRPPIQVGDTYGFLTVLELHGLRVRCQCQCGAVIMRDAGNMRSAKASCQTPKCKQCARSARRKNPGKAFGPMRV